MTTEEAVEILKKTIEDHKDDINVLDNDEKLWNDLLSYNQSSEPFKTGLSGDSSQANNFGIFQLVKS